MIYTTAILASLVAIGSASAASHTSKSAASHAVDAEDDTSEFYEHITSATHPAKMVKTANGHKKWVKFPEQHEAHVQALQQKASGAGLRSAAHTTKKEISLKTFFASHADTFGLTEKTVMKGIKTAPEARTHTTQHSYDQYYDGVKVLTGDYAVVVGAHEGVLHAHGRSYSGKTLRHTPAEFEHIKAKKVDSDAVYSKIKDLILKRNVEEVHQKVNIVKAKQNHKFQQPKHLSEPHRYGDLTEKDIEFKETTLELVIHPEWLGHNLKDSSLAYNVQGTVFVKGQFLAFDTCLDAETLESRLFVDKTNHFNVDLNDNDIRIFTSADPRNIGMLTWENKAPYALNTTGYAVGDLLVEATVQTRNLLYSLSGGEFLSFKKDKVSLDIVEITDPNVSSAFFDGDRIWFGPGFQTDDVIAHEWGHGYTVTMNNLYYYKESGALNEAFSDIIGEAIDILNMDTDDTQKRDSGIYTCTTDNSYAGSFPAPWEFTDPSSRWMLGEDIIIGAIRDMNNPECFFNPSNYRSWLFDYYACFDYYDDYGVHTNSGIMNKIFSLLADGGMQRSSRTRYYQEGAPVRSKGIGMTKALNLIFATYSDLTKFSDYQDAAVAMDTQCDLLITGDIYEPIVDTESVTIASKGMTRRDCKKVKTILKQAYVFDDSFTNAECDDLCDWAGYC